jgi:hypothetical protein
MTRGMSPSGHVSEGSDSKWERGQRRNEKAFDHRTRTRWKTATYGMSKDKYESDKTRQTGGELADKQYEAQ